MGMDVVSIVLTLNILSEVQRLVRRQQGFLEALFGLLETSRHLPCVALIKRLGFD